MNSMLFVRRIIRFFWGLPVVLLVRLVRPLFLVRFGRIESGRIGHFALEPELYLCLRAMNGKEPRTLDLFFLDSLPVCNMALAAMVRRALPVYPWVKALYLVNRMFPGWQVHEVTLPPSHLAERGKVLAQTAVQIPPGRAIEQRGQEYFKGFDLQPDAPFVCVINRDQAYLATVNDAMDWGYHDYRNCSIQSFFPAAERLQGEGYHVFRMGAAVADPQFPSGPRFVNYAVYDREDALDIFLCAHCRFFLGGDAGLIGLPMAMRRPIVLTNYVPLVYCASMPRSVLLVPKRFRERRQGRVLPYAEVAELGALSFVRSECFAEKGLEVVNNTAEEITAAALEMHAMLDGTYEPDPDDALRQQAFWRAVLPETPAGETLPQVSPAFLRKHEELL